jgi:hypothetical protein
MAELAEMTKLSEGKAITLYLEPWQKRMVRDYLKGIKPIRVFGKVTIDFTKPVHLNTYRVQFTDPREDDGIEIYFTDAQKAYLEEVTALKSVDSMRLNKAMLETKIIVIH